MKFQWQIIEMRDPSILPDTPDGSGQAWLLRYVKVVLTFILAAILILFTLGFMLIFVLPAMAIVGGIVLWRWRRLLKLQPSLFQNQQSHVKHSGQAQPIQKNDSHDEEIIDI